jgi:threonine dehydratase
MVNLEKIRSAARLIEKDIFRTPLLFSPTLSGMFGGQIHLKLENLQRTGSFKIRGATYKLRTCAETIGPGGVVAASAGNHAQGVALAATQAGIPATVIMPEWASISKQEATRTYGGEVVITGKTVSESLMAAQKIAERGKILIHPFNDEDIICGQGTLGLEIMQQISDPATVVVPIGGGGLISGVAAAVKSISPAVRIIGVQTTACPSARESLRQGRITSVKTGQTIADGISVKQIGEKTFEYIRRLVDEVVLVDESHIAAAILLLLERKKILAEGAGAVPLAALIAGVVKVPQQGPTVLIISGGNVDSPLLGRIISKGLLKKGRILRIWVRLEDVPGSLAVLLQQVARMEANVLHIHHDRLVSDLPLNLTCVELELETRGTDHVEKVVNGLRASGYAVDVQGTAQALSHG